MSPCEYDCIATRITRTTFTERSVKLDFTRKIIRQKFPPKNIYIIFFFFGFQARAFRVARYHSMGDWEFRMLFAMLCTSHREGSNLTIVDTKRSVICRLLHSRCECECRDRAKAKWNLMKMHSNGGRSRRHWNRKCVQIVASAESSWTFYQTDFAQICSQIVLSARFIWSQYVYLQFYVKKNINFMVNTRLQIFHSIFVCVADNSDDNVHRHFSVSLGNHTAFKPWQTASQWTTKTVACERMCQMPL